MRALVMCALAACADPSVTTLNAIDDKLTAAVAVQLNDVSVLYPLVDDEGAYVNILDPALGLKPLLDAMHLPEEETQGIPGPCRRFGADPMSDTGLDSI